MKTLVPHWPKNFPCRFKDRCTVTPHPYDGMSSRQIAEVEAIEFAKRIRRRDEAIRNTGLNGTYNETFFINEGDFTALSNSSSEGSLISGLNKQPFIPATWFLQQGGAFRGFTMLARGVFSTTSTPTLTFQVRAGTTSGPTFLSGVSLGVSPSITTASGVSNKWWELRLDMVCTVRGIGTGNATLSGAGFVASPSGFGTPFIFPLEPTTPDTATWTAVFDASLTQYLNLSATWSAASSSNTITCKQLILTAFG